MVPDWDQGHVNNNGYINDEDDDDEDDDAGDEDDDEDEVCVSTVRNTLISEYLSRWHRAAVVTND